MPAAALTFEQLARPVSHAEDGMQWHDPVMQFALSGGDYSVWCEMPRLDRAMDTLPWLALSDFPSLHADLLRVCPLRRTDTPWWTCEWLAPPVADGSSLHDLDLQRLMDDLLHMADHLGIDRFHVMAGGFSSVLALTMAARCPSRVASVVLDALFIPLRPVAQTYIRRLHDVDVQGAGATFGLCTDPSSFAANVLDRDLDLQLGICRFWESADVSLGSAGRRLEDIRLLRGRRLLAHLLAHDFFTSPGQWAEDLSRLARNRTPVTVVQALDDRIFLPSAARFVTDLLPQACLVELPGIRHGSDSSLCLSALSAAVMDHRRPSARLIALPMVTNRRTSAR